MEMLKIVYLIPMKYWLMKSEPNAYSIDDLKRDGVTPWDGIRNYRARNFMVKSMSISDLVLFYHSNAKPPGIVGIARVASKPYPDFTAFDPKSRYFSEKSTKEKPIWEMRDIAFVKKFDAIYSLESAKNDPKLEGMLLLQKGQRLSIQPVDKYHFDHICTICG